MRKRHPLVEANEIMPNLWQGSVPPQGWLLAHAGFRALVLCAREHQYPASSYPGIRVIHAPNDDSIRFPLTREKLRVAVRAARQVAEALRAGQSTLVTCAMGLNRSGLVSALTLHIFYGWSGDQCIAQIRTRRDPQAGFLPLSNKEFNTCLRRINAVDLACAASEE